MSRIIHNIVIALVCFIYFLHIAPSDSKLTDEALDHRWSYCFEFTWFGPDYDNATQYNGTCDDFLEEKGGDVNGIPCNPPIVITYDGTFPNIDYLWKYHKSSIICKRSTGQVCARYAFYFNGAMLNATYMCTKVEVIGEGVVKKGCFKQKVRDREVEVCVCESGKGLYKPCNIFPN